jgi:protein gp37
MSAMGDQTGISWCDRTFNIWIGCTKVSEGCKLCYAERDNLRYHWTDQWGPQGARHKTKYSPLSGWNKQYWMECTSCGWRGKMITSPECPVCGLPALRPTRQRVFVNSLSDLFEDLQEVLPWRNEFFAMTQMYSNLDYLLLTKRPENIARFSPHDWNQFGWPGNIWLGVSVENQARADERIPLLLKVPAAIRWLSVEPMLEAVDLRRVEGDGVIFNLVDKSRFDFGSDGLGVGAPMPPMIHWVIVGGESGPGCRPMDPRWAERILRQCKEGGIVCYIKQMGGHPNRRENLEDLPRDLQIREWPEVEVIHG